MYRIAIIDDNRQERSRTRHLAAAFFEKQGRSAAFVLCAHGDKLPDYYDCYLSGDGQSVQLLRGPEENPPWGSVPKPLEEEAFFEMLRRWDALPPAENPTPKPTRVVRRRQSPPT